MLTIPFLLLFLVTPAVFWFYGKRLLGSQTHPIALLFLTCIAAYVLLIFSKFTKDAGELTLLWVIVNFAVFALVKKLRQKPQPGAGSKEIKP